MLPFLTGSQGKGGFGEVVKARNRLDGRSYAISELPIIYQGVSDDPYPEKVKLRPEDNEQKVYREVNSLSRVSHQYIVRYYGCWLEEAAPVEQTPKLEASVGDVTSSEEEDDIFAMNLHDLSFSRREQSRTASFPRIRFAHSNEVSDNESNDSDSDSEASDATTAADPTDPYGRPIAIPPQLSTSRTDGTTDDGMVQRILYIQMEFVEKVRPLNCIAFATDDYSKPCGKRFLLVSPTKKFGGYWCRSYRPWPTCCL